MSVPLLVVVLATAAVAIVGSADAAALNCTARYQAVLQEALAIKQQCGILSTKIAARAQAGIYIIDDVCKHRETFQERATVRAKCDVLGEDGGWLVILRRDNTISSSDYVDFSHDWTDYVDGFGDLSAEFWYGLRNMHCLTTREGVDLKIIFKKSDGTEETYVYHTFRSSGGAHTNYALTIGGFQTPAPGRDNMAYHNGAQFSTRDADHDTWGLNCAAHDGRGGWWYKACSRVVFTTPHSSTVKIHCMVQHQLC